MLRRNIGKKNQKITSVKKSGSSVFPKTVWGFYLKYAVPGSTWALIAWAFCVLISTSESLLFPMILRWFVALFEADVPTGMTLFQYALPTILLIAGRTTVAIAHRLSTLRNMDRIIVLKDGYIIEQGTHNALVRRGGEYARLWKMQSGGFLQE